MDHGAVQSQQTILPRKEQGNSASRPLYSQGNPKTRSRLLISPPPVKRRRIDASHVASDESNTLYSLKPLGTSPSKLTLPDRTASLSLPIKLSSGHHALEGGDLSFASTKSFGSNQSKKLPHKCRSCSFPIVKAFDPMVRCPSCSRIYHESCRRPVWTKEQPEVERCFKCAPNQQKSRLGKESSLLSEADSPTPRTSSGPTPRPSSTNGSLKGAPLESSTFKLWSDEPVSAAPVHSKDQSATIEATSCEEQGGPDVSVRLKENGESNSSAHPGDQNKLDGPTRPEMHKDSGELPSTHQKASEAVAVVLPSNTESYIAPVESIGSTRLSTVSKSTTHTVSCNEEEEPHCKMRGIFMPFEDARDYLALHPRPLAPNVRRSSNFYDAFRQYNTTSIKTITTAEKEAKIAAIKKRPSRKSFFGDRLHPTRRLQRDPHDENESVPMPAPNNEPGASKGEKLMKETFNLPKNPVPILHDGQLAFRNGTLVNGKLPRSRVVYKVGRLLGGELRL